jgi:hypothetical protein
VKLAFARFGMMLAGFALAAAGAVVSARAADMIPEPLALIQGLDKINARVSQFEAPVGTSVRFGTLSVVVRDCERSPPEERPENAAFVEVYETRPGEARQRLFSGWMFSSSPALSALEHPVYDVNLLECRPASGSPVRAPAAAPAAPPTPEPASPPAKSRGKTTR